MGGFRLRLFAALIHLTLCISMAVCIRPSRWGTSVLSMSLAAWGFIKRCWVGGFGVGCMRDGWVVGGMLRRRLWSLCTFWCTILDGQQHPSDDGCIRLVLYWCCARCSCLACSPGVSCVVLSLCTCLLAHIQFRTSSLVRKWRLLLVEMHVPLVACATANEQAVQITLSKGPLVVMPCPPTQHVPVLPSNCRMLC